MRTHIKTLLIGWIWLATAFDIWCCQWLSVTDELNPVAQWIMVNYGLFAMVGCKVFGTWLATEWLRRLPLYYTVTISVLMLALVGILSMTIPAGVRV